ncbi:hypothetical protein NQZ79_g268 [Umbelopsis isabellina]|nr:hypothetical protein NQZ79_g268 [Umbelopsis isabellina]
MKFIQVRLAIAVLLFCGNAIASCTGLKGHDDHNQLEITTAYGVKHTNVAGFGPGDKSLRTRDLGCMEVPLVVDTVVRYKSTDMNPIHNSLKQQSTG